jgi:hypothetical protein
VALLVLWLVGCRNAETEATVTPAAGITPTATLLADLTPQPTVLATATTLADGVAIRLGTPDPSPNCPDHYPWFFDNPAEECAAALWNVWTAMQYFEHGLMVWFQEGGRTFVLIEDGSLFKPYHEVIDRRGLPLLAPDPAITPPAGLYQPILGFAKFWRGLAPGSEWVRQSLGWAVAPERGYSAFWQCNTASSDAMRCYFSGPGDEIIAMTRGSVRYWNYWQRPVR